ncbi:hypothetical protein C4571_00145 [Candidatus Parcubacteria bacterium]|nr:MAG: hypothetical protein C4571_00145 [Candidatus Parcubacteria bacterium]
MALAQKILVIVLFLLVAALAITLYSTGIIPKNWFSGTENGYQAVFLTNGQVYFGRLHDEQSNRPTLRDIYYFQAPSGETVQNFSLVKLGSELHGPVDEMRMNRDHILFVEDLRSDSRVAEAIREFKSGNQ